MAESLFRVFDEDNSGALNFFEYLQVEHKLKTTFKTILMTIPGCFCDCSWYEGGQTELDLHGVWSGWRRIHWPLRDQRYCCMFIQVLFVTTKRTYRQRCIVDFLRWMKIRIFSRRALMTSPASLTRMVMVTSPEKSSWVMQLTASSSTVCWQNNK